MKFSDLSDEQLEALAIFHVKRFRNHLTDHSA